MQQHHVKVISISNVTPDVLCIVTQKPSNYSFTSGQATEVSINKNGWTNKKRPFTFTCLPDNDCLEFTIKTYPAHHGVTDQLLKLKNNDELILHEVFGTISYQGEGAFIAGGAGVTPFISILRYLQSKNKIGNNKLIFANKTRADIILEQELKEILGDSFINILSDEKAEGFANGQITRDFIEVNCKWSKLFYLCGPPPMMDAVESQLRDLDVDAKSIIKESF